MRVTLAQVQVDRDVARNLAKILAVVGEARAGEWVVFPEGALSGYFPEDEDFLRRLDAKEIDEAIREIGDEVRRARCHCLVGTAARVDNVWRNAVFILGGAEPAVYLKAGLSRLDRRHFVPGGDPPVYRAGGATIGIQVCRELILPGPWMALKARGAQVIFHVNNAIKPHDHVWEHLLIARAVELGVFVCSVNNASPPQELTSYLISPSGRLLVHAAKQTEQVLAHEIDLAAVIPVLDERQDF